MKLSPRRSRQLASLFGLVLLLLLLIVQFGPHPVLERLSQRLELLAYDQRTLFHLPADPGIDPRIVVIDIDELALQEQGRWPWSRQRIAELVERLREAGVAMIGFDVLFAEPERNPVNEVADALASERDSENLRMQLQALAPRFDADRRLAEQLSQAEVVLGYTFNPLHPTRSGELPAPLPISNNQLIPQLILPEQAGYSAPLPILQAHAASAGFFSLQPDPDGVVRRAPLLVRHQDQLYGSLALQMLRHLFFIETLALETALINHEYHIEAIQLDQALRIPTDGLGRMLVPYRGPAGSFPYLSAQHVFTGEFDPDLLAGAMVLVGTTAPGLFDLRATPVGEIYPGVEVHANLLASFLDERYLQEPPWADGANFLIALLTGLLLALLMPRLAPIWMILLSLLATLVVVLLTAWYWREQGLVLALAAPLVLIASLTTFNLSWGFFFESLTRHRLKDMFGQYVPPELVEEMSDHPGDFGFDGASRELSVLFADIRSFTTISESLDANELKRYLNQYFTPMTRIIFEHRGTIDKYVGDMVMAFWGAPVEEPQHAVHAIEAALAMLAETERLKPEFAARGWPEVNIGVGINSGIMNVGDMGSEYRRSYTVLGDAVNLASRLEGTTKYYGVGLVIGEHTHALAGDHFVYRELDRVQVKGKHEAITVYQPVCPRSQANASLLQELDDYHQALQAFRQQAWDEADALFGKLTSAYPDSHLYQLYRERIAECRTQDLGPDWDGVYIRDTK